MRLTSSILTLDSPLRRGPRSARGQRLHGELSAILEYVNRLEELEPGRAAEPEPPDQPLREDLVNGWPDPAWFLEQAVSRDGFFLVPRVIE